MDRQQAARELVKLAKSLTADDLYDFWSAYEREDWPFGAVFPGKKRPGKRPRKSGKMPRLSEDSLLNVVDEVLTFKRLNDPEALVFTFLGTAGRPDTYVFTKVPFEEAFAAKGAKPPKKSVAEIALDVKTKLRELGLHALGRRYGKAGEQFGFPGLARVVAVGRRDLLLNRFQVVIRNESQVRRPQESWVMAEGELLSKVTDKMLENAARWVKKGKSMVEVRDDAREKYEQEGGLVVLRG